MTQIKDNRAPLETKARKSIVVVYEDPAAREQAVGFCDQLVKRFWSRLEFDVSWWSFALLEQASTAKNASEKAARADVIVVSATPGAGSPWSVKAWMESWLAERGDREGVLAGLLGHTTSLDQPEGPKHHFLRYAARRCAMDYLTQVPLDLLRAMPDSIESYTKRADQVTSLLDDILHQQTSPSGLAP